MSEKACVAAIGLTLGVAPAAYANLVQRDEAGGSVDEAAQVAAATSDEASETPGAAPDSTQPRSLLRERQQANGEAAPGDPDRPIRFAFDDATLEQVLDFFSRETGLPVVREADLPEARFTYRAPEAYDLDEALRVLNILLQTQGVMLRVSDEMLYLQKLEAMVIEDLPTYQGEVPAEVTNDQIVVNVIPLQNALASTLVEPLKTMVATYGSVTAMPSQNSLVLVETAGKVRQLQRIIEQLDAEDPQGMIEIFRIEHVKASVLMTPLQALMAEKVEKYILNQQGQQQKVEETEIRGLTISHDDRTNSIIAKGMQSKIDELREAIQLLDVPESTTQRAMRTFALLVLSPAEAVNKLNALYAKMPEPERPTIVPLENRASVTVIGSAAAINEASTLLREIDGNGDGPDAPSRNTISIIPLEHGNADAILSTINRLLSQQQTLRTKIVAGQDARSLILSGPDSDIQEIATLIETLDTPSTVDRDVRIIEIATPDPAATLARAQELYQQQIDAADPAQQVTVEFDETSGAVTAIGAAPALDRFAGTLGLLEQHASLDVRLIELDRAGAAEITSFLEQFISDGAMTFGNVSGPTPRFLAVERLNALLVSARSDQHPIIESIVRNLDQEETREMPPLRILQLRTADAANFAQTLTAQYSQRSAEERREKPVTITADPNTNALMVAAHPDLLVEIEAVVEDLNQVNRADAEGREIRIFPLTVARAEELATVIDEMYPKPEPLLDRRGQPIPGSTPPREVVVRADPQTNSLIVDATIQRMAGFEKLVEQLDRQRIEADTEIRTYRVVHADLDALAQSLRNLAQAGSLGEGDRQASISISAEPVSQTLVVSGPTAIYDKLESVLNALDVQRPGPSTSLRFMKLEHTRAETVAEMLREILIARLDEEVPEAGANAQALLNVSTDRKTNMLIISAPDALMPIAEELVQQLDAPGAGGLDSPIVRVRPLTFADAGEITQSLSQALPQMTSKATGEPVDVRLIAAGGSNAIILVGLEADMAQVEELLVGLDQQQSTEAMDAETFTLQFASAREVAPVLQKLLTNQQKTDPRIVAQRLRSTRGELDLTPEIQVEATGENRLIVSGAKQTVELARTLITQLDQPEETGERIVATFNPQTADASTLIETVQRVIESTSANTQRQALELLAEPASGAIIVIGPQEETEQAMSLLQQWDEAALRPPQVDLKIVSLEHTDADVVAGAIQPLLNDPSRWPEHLRRMADRGAAIAPPTVTADAAANRLLISAPQELMPLASDLVQQLDRVSDNAVVDVRIFNLTTAKAPDVATAISAAFASRAASRPGEAAPTVTAESSSNSIIVSATQAQMQEIESIVNSVDEGVAVDQTQVRTIFLKEARAEHIAPIIEQLLAGEDDLNMEDMPSWMRRDMMYMRYQTGERPTVRVAADTRLNAIVISATSGVLDVAEEMVAQLDTADAAAAGESRAVRVITLQNADATQMRDTLDAIFAEDTAAAPPTIRVDAASNSLIVRGSAEQFGSIESIVADVDAAAIGFSREIQTISIDPSRASAAEVAETLRRMLDPRGGSTVEIMTVEELLQQRQREQGRSAPAADEPDDRQSSLRAPWSASAFHIHPDWRDLVVATAIAVPPGDWRERLAAEEPVAQVAAEDNDDHDDRPSSAGSVPRSDEPGESNATAPQERTPEVEPLRNAAHQSAAADAADGSDITIAVDEQTNSLVVIGSPRAVERVRNLAQQIQQQLPAMPGRVRYIALPDAVDANQTSQLINGTLRQMVPAGGARGDFQQRVSVVPDQVNNALIVAANDIDFETVADLVVALSQPPATEQVVVKVYPLQKITAERAATSVRDLVGLDADAASRNRRGRQSDRMRRMLDVELQAQGRTVEGVFDPTAINVTSDEHSNALIVMGPAEAIGFIDQFVELIDQSALQMDASMRLFTLKHAEAGEIERIVQTMARARYNALPSDVKRTTIQPEVAADSRTNSLLVSASPEQIEDVAALLTQLDVELGSGRHQLRMRELTYATPSQAAEVLERVVIANDQDLARETAIVPFDDTGMLLIRASEELNAEIDRVLGELDRDTAQPFKVRTIVLERADAESVAETVRTLFEDRARISRGGRNQAQRRISIVGDQSSNTLLVSAPDDVFAQIEELVREFDSEKATRKLEFKVYELRHAKALDLQRTVQELVNELTWNQGPMMWYDPWSSRGRRNQGNVQGTVAIRANERLNVLIVSGEGDKFEIVDDIVATLDAPVSNEMERSVRILPVRNADLAVIEDVVRDTFARSTRSFWEPADPNEVILRSDEQSRSLIASGPATELDRIAELIATLDAAGARAEQTVTVLNVENAAPADVARTLTQFLEAHAEAAGEPRPTAAIIPSDNAGSLVVSATQAELATIRDLLTRLDQPLSDNRIIEIIALKKGDAEDIARILTEQFGSRSGQGLKVTADIRTNSLIINSPKETWAAAQEMLALLDAPPPSDEMIIRTYALEGAQAGDVMDILRDTLELDASGETSGVAVRLEELEGDAVVVDAKITADSRSNSLVVRATPESFPIIEQLISKMDSVESRNPLEWRILKLEHALVYDVSWTLRQFLRQFDNDDAQPRIDYNESENQLFIAATADQFKQIEALLDDIDLPKEMPVTQFVTLDYADAQSVRDALSAFYGPFALYAQTPEQLNTRIAVNEATNSLLISSDQSEWENIQRYIQQFDSEEFDPSLQLRVIPLKYADATSVAQAINDSFAGQVQGRQPQQDDRQPRQPSPAGDEDRRNPQAQQQTVLVEAEDWVRAGAEPMTNTVIVSASRQNLKKIETIVAELDVAEYAQGPAPRIIAVTNGSATQLAQSLNDLYQQGAGGRNARSRRFVRIVPNDASSTLIVRAEPEEFAEIAALAEALQQEAQTQGLTVHVLKLDAAPAMRVEAAIREAFAAKAQQTAQPFSIKSDPAANSLIIASTMGLFNEIEETVKQLDAMQPAAGQGIFIIELENIDPASATSIIETIGLHEEQDPESVSRLVTEPIRVSPLLGRNALIVVANPVDRDTIVGIVKAIDAAPDASAGETEMRIVQLRNADAEAVATILRDMISSDNQQSDNKLAQAVQEQLRRLSIAGRGVNGQDISLDLTRPIRVIVNSAMNAIIVGSTPENLAALQEVISTLDRLPIGEAVVVQMFPLENIRAEEFRRIVQDLFDQADQLGSAPGSDIPGLPTTEAGKALLGDVAMTIDERTNTIVIAGTQETVAFVEVMKMRLDSQAVIGWVEPQIIRLTHADATDLSETIQAILIEGADDLPQSTPLQQQVGRIRMNHGEHSGESDLFVPMSRLIVRPDPQLNALIIVGTPGNVQVIRELVTLFDIPAASPDATVRIYPVHHASASRIAATVSALFDQQVQTKAIRPEDAVIVEADERTNSLVVTTSPRSFAVLESLLRTLDAEVAPDLREIRRIEIKNASSTRLASMIQELMDARLERLRVVEPETADFEKVSIVADERTNSLVVAAGNDSFQVIRQLAAELDTATELAGSGLQVLPVQRTNVERVAETLNQIFERRYADLPPEIKSTQQPMVLTDPRSNSLLIAANQGDFESIRRIVEQLESTPLNPAVAIHVIPLDTKRAEELAPWLQTLMEDRLETLGAARTDADRISIYADHASNSLIVAANEEHIEVIRNTITALVKAESERPDGDIEIISLARMRASNVIDVIDELYVAEENRRRGEGTILVTADDRINALIVNAPQKDVEEIRSLVARLDGQRAPDVFEIQAITLAAADPLEIVGLIEEVLRGPGLAGRRNAQQATVFRLITRAAEEGGVVDANMDEVEISTAIRESISLTPDRRTNSVIVSAPKESMGLIRNLIETLDSSESSNLNMRIFALQNADADATAEILEELFRTPTREVLTPRADQALADPDALAEAAFASTELTSVPDERKQLSITVDNRTNSLLVAGTPRYLELVEQVVATLDTREGNERVQWVYQLKNAVAEDVARVVGEFVEADQQKLLDTLSVDQLGSANRILEREVTIVGDEKSNTVLVSASPRYVDRVKSMVTQLDIDPPQVLIQVLLAEVTLDSGDEWGVAANVEGEAGDVEIGAGFDLASAFLTGVGIPNLSIAGTDFNLMIRALESQGRLHVLSNPSIMTANNEAAQIQVGETIRVPAATQVTDSGINSTVVEEELGVILNVTPTINPDGYVRMDINPEISNLSSRTTQISENFQSPVITVRRADTVVTVLDGQTIVLGGLISDRFEIREEAVPLLGDLPIIGALFRSESEQRAKTELLIVLTPHVVKSPSDVPRVDFLTDREIDRLSLPDYVKDQIRRGRVEGTGGIFDANGNRIDADPTKDESIRREDEDTEAESEYIRVRKLQ